MKQRAIIFPGFTLTHRYYATLASRLQTQGFNVVFAPIPGVFPHLNQTLPAYHPRDFALHILGELASFADDLLIGHSWGGHVARCFTLLGDGCSSLWEIDSRLVPQQMGASVFEGVQERFPSRPDVVSYCESIGAAEHSINWDSFVEQSDGSWALSFNPRAAIRALNPDPPMNPFVEWAHLHQVWPISAIHYAAAIAGSINAVEDVDRIAQLESARLHRLPWLSHAFGMKEQETFSEYLATI